MSTCSEKVVLHYQIISIQNNFTIKVNVLGFCITEKVEKEHGNHNRKLERKCDERNVVVVKVELVANNDGSKEGLHYKGKVCNKIPECRNSTTCCNKPINKQGTRCNQTIFLKDMSKAYNTFNTENVCGVILKKVDIV